MSIDFVVIVWFTFSFAIGSLYCLVDIAIFAYHKVEFVVMVVFVIIHDVELYGDSLLACLSVNVGKRL